MTIKYSNIQNSPLWFERDGIYEVFCIEVTKDGIKLYLYWNSQLIYPISIEDSEIVDNTISADWKIGKNNSWDLIIGPSYVFEMDDFWWNYYEQKIEYIALVKKNT